MNVKIIHSDCLVALREMESESVDSVVCDPPYGLSNTKPAQVSDVLAAWVTGDTEAVPAKKGGFMGADWDSFVPPPAVWAECLRVLKPGGHMAVFAGARTQDLMGLSIRLAGFEIREGMGWIFGSGFPKSHSVKKATLKKVEERYGAARCDCLDSRNGQSDWDGIGQGGRGQAGSEGGSRQVPPQEVGDRAVSNVTCGAGDGVCKLWGEGGEESCRIRQVEEALLLNGVRKCGAEEAGYGHAEVRVGVETSEGRDSREGQGVPLVWQESGDERECAPCSSLSSVQVQRDEQAGESSSSMRFVSSQHRVTDGQGSRIDPGRCEPRRVNADGGCGWGESVARVCSWCGLPDRAWLDGLEPLGTALKPAIEPIILARKPLDGTVAANVLAHGVGGLNIDACRVKGEPIEVHVRTSNVTGANSMSGTSTGSTGTGEFRTDGRFPANVLLDEHAAAEMDEQSGVGVSRKGTPRRSKSPGEGYGMTHTGAEYNDQGGASRFFPVFKYQAKAPKKERPVIVREDGTKVQHVTVKPLGLMEWLVTLITPEGGTTLDPFAGTGTTLQAARDKGFNAIGVEQDEDYIALIEQRLGGAA